MISHSQKGRDSQSGTPGEAEGPQLPSGARTARPPRSHPASSKPETPAADRLGNNVGSSESQLRAELRHADTGGLPASGGCQHGLRGLLTARGSHQRQASPHPDPAPLAAHILHPEGALHPGFTTAASLSHTPSRVSSVFRSSLSSLTPHPRGLDVCQLQQDLTVFHQVLICHHDLHPGHFPQTHPPLPHPRKDARGLQPFYHAPVRPSLPGRGSHEPSSVRSEGSRSITEKNDTARRGQFLPSSPRRRKRTATQYFSNNQRYPAHSHLHSRRRAKSPGSEDTRGHQSSDSQTHSGVAPPEVRTLHEELLGVLTHYSEIKQPFRAETQMTLDAK